MPCTQCGFCCRTLSFVFPNNQATLDWLLRRGFKIKQKSKQWVEAYIMRDCNHITKNNECALHDGGHKPEVCKMFPSDSMIEEKKKYGLSATASLSPHCGYKVKNGKFV